MTGFKVEPFQRPEFMVRLGLRPPYSPSDIKQAYRQKAKTAHPDAGGSAAEYTALHDAYEQALDFAKFHAGRSRWIGEEMELYIARLAIVTAVESRGGYVTMQRIEGLRPWVGEDFGQIKDKLIAIQWRGKEVNDESLASLIENQQVLSDLQHLDLAHSSVTSDGLLQLHGMTGLTALDLHDTPIDNRGLEVIKQFDRLEWLHIGGTKINWRGRMKLKLARPQLHVATGTSKHKHRR